MQLAHVIVSVAGHPLADQADRVLEREREVPAKAMRLEAAGLDQRLGLVRDAGKGKPRCWLPGG
jgi:hypothetical protein